MNRVALPDGRTVVLGDDVQDRVAAGVLVAEGIVVGEVPAVWERTILLGERLRQRHAGRRPSEISGLREARDLYHAFGMEPTRYRPSSEALLRRVLKGQDLNHINNVVDCCNLASLSFLLPIGLYDLERVEGDVVLRLGRAGESYPGIRKGEVNLAGRLGLFDAAGPFGSPTSDSTRTAVGSDTTRLLAVVTATSTYAVPRLRAHLDLLGGLFTAYCAARVSGQKVLGAEDPT